MRTASLFLVLNPPTQKLTPYTIIVKAVSSSEAMATPVTPEFYKCMSSRFSQI